MASVLSSFFLCAFLLLPVAFAGPLAPAARQDDAPALYFVSLTNTMTPRVKIEPYSRFCPQLDLGTSEFSVVCETSSATATRARFIVAGDLVRTDRVAPFTLTEGRRGVPFAWTTYPDGRFAIKCVLNDGTTAKVGGIRIRCPRGVGASPTASPVASASASPMVEASPSAAASMSPSPSQSDDGLSPAQRDAGCLILPVKDVPLSEGWVQVEDGIAFRPGNTSTALTWRGRSSVYVPFRPIRSGRHAVVVDLTTSGKADYNDIWMRLDPNGFQLRRDGVGYQETGWIKGFQKLNGRGATIVSGDHDPHSVSTWDELVAGQEYVFGLGGRSNQVTIHRLLMFVCEGDGCEKFPWRSTQNLCIPNSFPRRK